MGEGAKNRNLPTFEKRSIREKGEGAALPGRGGARDTIWASRVARSLRKKRERVCRDRGGTYFNTVGGPSCGEGRERGNLPLSQDLKPLILE